jgi:hypothetical protein
MIVIKIIPKDDIYADPYSDFLPLIEINQLQVIREGMTFNTTSPNLRDEFELLSSDKVRYRVVGKIYNDYEIVYLFVETLKMSPIIEAMY